MTAQTIQLESNAAVHKAPATVIRPERQAPPALELSLLAAARHAVPHLVEGALIPVVVFYLALWAFGVWGALLAALSWSYLALARRAITGSKAGGVLMVTAVTLTVRFAMAVATGSTAVYFVQPVLAKAVLALALLWTLRSPRPLIRHIVNDFVPISDETAARWPMQLFFHQASLIVAGVLMAHAVVGLGLLVSQPIEVYVTSKTILNTVVKATLILLVAVQLKRALRESSLVG